MFALSLELVLASLSENHALLRDSAWLRELIFSLFSKIVSHVT